MDEDGQIVLAERAFLVPSIDDYKEQFAGELVLRFINHYWDRVFSRARVVLVEKQMESKSMSVRKFIVVSTYIDGILKGRGVKVRIVLPIMVRRWANTSMGDYDENKKASIKLMKRTLPPREFSAIKTRLGGAKMDDVADSWVIALYARSCEVAAAAEPTRKRSRVDGDSQRREFSSEEATT